MRAKLNKLATLLDMRDLLTFGGLGVLGYGLYLIHPAASFVVIGALLFWLGASHG